MDIHGAFGATMAGYFGAERVCVRTRGLQLASRIAMTHLRCDGGGTGLTAPIPREQALVVAVQFQPLAAHDLWIGGRHQPVQPYARGAVSMVDLDCEPVAWLGSPYDTLQFYLPAGALRDIAAREGGPVLTGLAMPHGVPDPVIAQVATMVCYLAHHPEETSAALLDGLVLTLYARLAHRYAGTPQRSAVRQGGLAQWQERLVKEMIDARLDGNLSLAEMADACGLSAGHFARAFRRSTGEPPHGWLRRRRLARAEHLLLTSQLTLSDIALACGYADQSHLSKAFKVATGASPAAWRRVHARGPR